jgi:hypothetical protein
VEREGIRNNRKVLLMVVKGVNLKKYRIFFIIKMAKDNGYGERGKIKRERKKK